MRTASSACLTASAAAVGAPAALVRSAATLVLEPKQALAAALSWTYWYPMPLQVRPSEKALLQCSMRGILACHSRALLQAAARQSSCMQAQRIQKEDTKGYIRMEVKLLNGADVILQLVRSPVIQETCAWSYLTVSSAFMLT